MRELFVGILLFVLSMPLMGQEDATSTTVADSDTTIYRALPDMPRFPGCERFDTTLAAKKECAQRIMLAYIYQNIEYPLEARTKAIQGKVVVSFVVEKDGTITNSTVLKDIGGGCGEEALRVINRMTPDGVRWVPGLKDGKPVRTQKTIPISFKLEKEDPFVMMGQDSVWVITDKPLEFEGGADALAKHINDRLEYPASAKDSCFIGDMDVKLLIDRQGNVRVLDLIDYSGLGFDFWYSATNASTSTIGKWTVAEHEGQKVPSAYQLVMTFLPEEAHCQTKVDNYNQASTFATEGVELYNKEQPREAIAKLDQAIQLFEGNAQFHYLRGQIHLGLKNYPEACSDLTLARDIAQLNDFDSIISIICK
ncbi:MAG: TonB family protein [Bacteroidota bacterium]